jgi:hypothetical protein
LPKQYKVEIKKAGFHPWQKDLEIKEKQVQEFKNIVLVPKNPNFTILSKNIENFWSSPDKKKLIKKTIDEDNNWNLLISDLEKNLSFPLLKEKELENGSEIINLEFSQNSLQILLKTKVKEKIKYFILKIDRLPPVSLFSLDSLKNLEKISFHPQDNNKIFFLKANNLYEIDYTSPTIESLILKDLLSYEIFGDTIFWLSRDGFLYKSDLSGKLLEAENLRPFLLHPDFKYEIVIADNSKIFLKEGSNFYQLNFNSRDFEKIEGSFSIFKFSPDLKKVAYSNGYEIGVLFLEPKYEQPERARTEKVYLTRFSEKIKDLFWFTPDYLILSQEEKVKIIEIDNRDRVNTVDLIELENSKTHWQDSEKKIYLLSKGNLYVSENLIK